MCRLHVYDGFVRERSHVPLRALQGKKRDLLVKENYTINRHCCVRDLDLSGSRTEDSSLHAGKYVMCRSQHIQVFTCYAPRVSFDSTRRNRNDLAFSALETLSSSASRFRAMMPPHTPKPWPPSLSRENVASRLLALCASRPAEQAHQNYAPMFCFLIATIISTRTSRTPLFVESVLGVFLGLRQRRGEPVSRVHGAFQGRRVLPPFRGRAACARRGGAASGVSGEMPCCVVHMGAVRGYYETCGFKRCVLCAWNAALSRGETYCTEKDVAPSMRLARRIWLAPRLRYSLSSPALLPQVLCKGRRRCIAQGPVPSTTPWASVSCSRPDPLSAPEMRTPNPATRSTP